MAKSIRWVGNVGTLGDFTALTNWIDLSTGIAPIAAPANDDTLIFDRGSVDVSVNNTGSLTGLIVVGTQGYGGRVVLDQTSFASIRWDSGQLEADGNVTAAIVRCRRATKFVHSGGTFTAGTVVDSDSTFQSDSVVTTLRCSGPGMTDIAPNATDITALDVEEGHIVQLRRDAPIQATSGATVVVVELAEIKTGTVVDSGALIDDRSTTNVPGSITVKGRGRYTLQRCPVVKTLNTLNEWPRAKVELDTLAGTVAPSTHNKFFLTGQEGIENSTPIS